MSTERCLLSKCDGHIQEAFDLELLQHSYQLTFPFFPASCAFASLVMFLGTPRCTHPSPLTHRVSLLPPLVGQPVSCYGAVLWASELCIVRRNPQKALHIRLDELHLRLEMSKGFLRFLFSVTPNPVVHAGFSRFEE